VYSLCLLTALNETAGVYDCVVTNTCGSDVTGTATLTLGSAPVINGQPGGLSVCEGSTFVLGVTATGTPDPTYQWRLNGVNIPGAVTSGYSAVASSAMSGTYDCVLSNRCGSITSAPAPVSVTYGPVILVQPNSQSGCPGQSMTFLVSVTGDPAPTYQWRKNGTNIEGETQSSLSVITGSDTVGDYDCILTNSCGSVISQVATLTLGGPPVIQTQPSSVTVYEGSPATFSLGATGASFYQWRKNGGEISGANADSYTIPITTFGDAGSYDCVAKSDCGGVLSDAATLTVLCYANCDGSTVPPVLNVGDFTCFLQKYAAGDPYANCDGSTTEPILNVGDFTCFLQKYAAGCP
jgi:hypothetical protein